jgi:hypothetical protein
MTAPPVLIVRVTGIDPGRLRALRLLVPDFEWRGEALRVPLADQSPEEVLAACCAVGLLVRRSRVEPPGARG